MYEDYEPPERVSEEKGQKLRELHEEKGELMERYRNGEDLSDELHEINDRITEVLMA